MPARFRFLLAPFSAAVAAVLIALFLPLAEAKPEEQQTPAPAAVDPSRCHPLADDAKDICTRLVELEVKDVIPLAELQTHAVLLVSKDGKTMLPIFVDEAAAVSIAFRLAKREPPHPLAQDLLDSVVTNMGGKVTGVRIDDLEDDIFVGRIVIRQGEQDHALDARPSDSIAMAIKGGAPILAARKVMDEAGISEEEIDAMIQKQQPGVGGSGLGGSGLGLPPGHPAVPGPGPDAAPEAPTKRPTIEL